MYLTHKSLSDFVWDKYDIFWDKKDIDRLVHKKILKIYHFGRRKVFKREEVGGYLEKERRRNQRFTEFRRKRR